jgi:GAF domain-containing protein/HAMP domain-containing protein
VNHEQTSLPRQSRPRQSRPTSLRFRLVLIALLASLPILVLIALLLTRQAQDRLETAAIASLRSANQTIAYGSQIWLNENSHALTNLASLQDIKTMRPADQESLLTSMANAYPQMYLVSTTDLNGMNIARSDGQEARDYSDRAWFQQAAGGADLTYQTLQGRTSGQPAIVSSRPILGEDNQVVGVAMYAADLDDVAALLRSIQLGQAGIATIIDTDDYIVAHTDPNLTAELRKASEVPELQGSLQALRNGVRGPTLFQDPNGVTWRAEIQSLENGWGIITQQPETALFAPVLQFRNLAIIFLVLGAGFLILLSWSVIGRALRPVATLTAAAEAVAQGNLEVQAPLTSRDELGLLATAFNSMTNQLRSLVGELEERVEERTGQLERRALQLQVTADVAREAAASRDLELLLADAVRLISQRFGFYHAGIFLVGAASQNPLRSAPPANWAVLRAASSQGGQKMLARGHRLRVGQVGIVGYVAASGQPRIALDVGEDAVFFNNPDLPLTRSEMALPLKVEQRIIGVLDVQSQQQGAFNKEDLDTLQILADQLALAIESARLLNESQQSARELETLLGLQTSQRWRERTNFSSKPGQKSGRLGYTLDPRSGEVVEGPADRPDQSADRPDQSADRPDQSADRPDQSAAIPGSDQPDLGRESLQTIQTGLEVRGQKIGSLLLKRSADQPWTDSELQLVQRTVQQAALALENARLLEEIQQRAAQEQIINQVTASLQRSMNVDTVMRSAVEQVGRLIQANALQIRLVERRESGPARSAATEQPDPLPSASEPGKQSE